MRADRRGFTLMELTLALALAGMALLGARTLLSQLADASERMTRERIEQTAMANGETLLRALLSRADASRDSSQVLRGTATEVNFGSWCESPAGWLEPCAVSLGLSIKGDVSELRASFGQSSLRLGRWSAEARFTYLDPLTRRWSSAWSRTSNPAAVALVDGDTVFYRLGAGQ